LRISAAGILLAGILCLGTLLSDASASDFPLDPYKPVYVLTTWDGTHPVDREDHEIAFQISFKKQILKSPAFPFSFGYTQKSFWQFYDHAESAPFRETNYNPEFFLDYRDLGCWGCARLDIQVGLFEHESNGRGVEVQQRAGPLPDNLKPFAGSGTPVSVNMSRSWNRTYIKPTLHWTGSWETSVSLKVWGRWAEPGKHDPLESAGDDNPGIEKYLGNTEFTVQLASLRDTTQVQRATLMLRQGSLPGTTTAQVDYALDLATLCNQIFTGCETVFTAGWSLHLQAFYGYGESLIDYNRLIRKFGVGLSVF
jgi:phospholipase A1